VGEFPSSLSKSQCFLLLLKHYSTLWTRASNTVILHSLRCDNCMPIAHSRLSSNLLQPHQSICSVVFHFPSLLPFWQSLFGILSLFIPSVSPHRLNQSQFINFTMPAPCNISRIYLCLFPAFFFLYVTINLPQCFGIIGSFETVP